MPVQFGISIKAHKAGFFLDPEGKRRLLDRVDVETWLMLVKFGAWVRRRAQTSMRRRKWKISPPGSPPYAHTGLLRNYIEFSYDHTRKAVVIGPTRLNTAETRVPALLEFGGPAMRRFRVHRKQEVQVRAKPAVRGVRRPKKRLARIATFFRSWWNKTLWGKAAKKKPAVANPHPDTVLLYSASMAPRPVTYRPRPYMGPAWESTVRDMFGG
jgi:hypothetical protein